MILFNVSTTKSFCWIDIKSGDFPNTKLRYEEKEREEKERE